MSLNSGQRGYDMSSRTNLRLELMREQAMQQDRQNRSKSPISTSVVSNPMNIRSNANGRAVNLSSSGGGNNATSRSSPIIISHPIKFSGNRLVHLPPQIIHMATSTMYFPPSTITSSWSTSGINQHHPVSSSPIWRVQRRNDDSATPNNMAGGSSVPIGFGTPPKVTVIRQERINQTSRQSPSVDSPPGYGDSPHSASFPSHSELDDYIIDEILSLEDDQLARKQQPPLPGTYSCTDNLATLSHHHAVSSAGRPIPVSSSSSTAAVVVVGSASPSGYNRQVSSSAPASSLDMDSLVRQEVVLSEQEFFRDRRKKDIHNMIERRRRYNINDRIKELGMMLPKHSSEYVYAQGDMKLNKGTILKASCDYIRHLQRDRDHMTRVSIQQSRLETTARLYADRIKELEAQLQKNGITIPPATLPAMPTTIMTRSIKQEPIDDSNSPINTPSGSMSSSVFMSQLSDTTAAMAITSPTVGHHHHQNTAPSSFFSVASSRSPDSPSFSTPQQQLSSNNWQQQQQQQHFPDLIMEDLATIGGTGPLLQGDPMISAAGGGPSPQTAHSQMSPDVQWDQAGFSPDSDSRNSSHHHHQHHQMDFS